MKHIRIKKKKSDWCVYYYTRHNKFREDYQNPIDALSRFVELQFKEFKKRLHERNR